MTGVDPDEFAAQVNYLAAIGRMVVPRAFAFANMKVLFVGHGPFDPEDTAALLPESAEWWELDAAPEGFVPDVIVLGREGFEKGSIKAAVGRAAGSLKVNRRKVSWMSCSSVTTGGRTRRATWRRSSVHTEGSSPRGLRAL